MIPDEAEIFEYVTELLVNAESQLEQHQIKFDNAVVEDNTTIRILEAGDIAYWTGVIDVLRKVRRYVRNGVKEE